MYVLIIRYIASFLRSNFLSHIVTNHLDILSHSQHIVRRRLWCRPAGKVLVR